MNDRTLTEIAELRANVEAHPERDWRQAAKAQLPNLFALADEVSHLRGALTESQRAFVQALGIVTRERDEARTALENERGEGAPPEPGWTWAHEGDIPDPCWHHPSGAVVYMETTYTPAPPGHVWLWWVPGMPGWPGMPGCESSASAQGAMRAAAARMGGVS